MKAVNLVVLMVDWKVALKVGHLAVTRAGCSVSSTAAKKVDLWVHQLADLKAVLRDCSLVDSTAVVRASRKAVDWVAMWVVRWAVLKAD